MIIPNFIQIMFSASVQMGHTQTILAPREVLDEDVLLLDLFNLCIDSNLTTFKENESGIKMNEFTSEMSSLCR